jgi:probable rRNA maturation factor
MWLEWRLDADVRLPDMQATRALLARAAEAVVALELPLPGKYQACVVLTDDAGIRALNRRTRGIDAATDVLSFPQATFPRGLARDYPARLRVLLDPDTGRRHLGDIVISTERAQAQAEDFGHSARREMAYLLTHGMCHLLGHDHQNALDTARMRALEERALALVGALREPDVPGNR